MWASSAVSYGENRQGHMAPALSGSLSWLCSWHSGARLWALRYSCVGHWRQLLPLLWPKCEQVQLEPAALGYAKGQEVLSGKEVGAWAWLVNRGSLSGNAASGIEPF